MPNSWGNFPKTKSTLYNLEEWLKDEKSKEKEFIPFGNGRSYGDSALASNQVQNQNKKISTFDEKSGIIECDSGILISDILKKIVPKGWFLPVVPGTKLITIGGAIASDVHGKNHHSYGCFSKGLLEFKLLLPDESIKTCSFTQNKELFLATCGGMGLTGVILSAKIQLTKINSSKIQQTTIKNKNLKETFESFKKYNSATYSVAWIDCLSTGENLGRSILMVGEFIDDFNYDYSPKRKFNIPFYFPRKTLNAFTIKIFNHFYYHKQRPRKVTSITNIDQFFFPLDSIRNWNRIYGRKGFLQYQFILPYEKSFEGLELILKKISEKKIGSFLSVLKLYGSENDNYLSFPMKGYSLALDFPISDGLSDFLHQLDHEVARLGGRVYLSKDANMRKEFFHKTYPKINMFLAVRNKFELKNIQSLQSKRLGL